jgi:hypothetical protein
MEFDMLLPYPWKVSCCDKTSRRIKQHTDIVCRYQAEDHDHSGNSIVSLYEQRVLMTHVTYMDKPSTDVCADS